MVVDVIAKTDRCDIPSWICQQKCQKLTITVNYLYRFGEPITQQDVWKGIRADSPWIKPWAWLRPGVGETMSSFTWRHNYTIVTVRNHDIAIVVLCYIARKVIKTLTCFFVTDVPYGLSVFVFCYIFRKVIKILACVIVLYGLYGFWPNALCLNVTGQGF